MSLAEKRPDKAGERAVGIEEQQTISRLPGQERVKSLIAPGPSIQLGQGSCRDRDIAPANEILAMDTAPGSAVKARLLRQRQP